MEPMTMKPITMEPITMETVTMEPVRKHLDTLTLSNVQSVLEKLVDYIRPHLDLANLQLMYFITRNQWDEFLSRDLREELLELSDTELGLLPGGNVQDSRPCLARWSKRAQQHSVCSLLRIPTIDEYLQDNADHASDVRLRLRHFMNAKKSHEVELMAEAVAVLARKANVEQVIDVGSGKGYLGSYLSLRHGLNVIGLDSNSSNTWSAVRRGTKVRKHWPSVVQQGEVIARAVKEEVARDQCLDLVLGRRSTKRKMKAKNASETVNISSPALVDSYFMNTDLLKREGENFAQISLGNNNPVVDNETGIEVLGMDLIDDIVAECASDGCSSEDRKGKGRLKTSTFEKESDASLICEANLRAGDSESGKCGKQEKPLYKPVTHCVGTETTLSELLPSGDQRHLLSERTYLVCGLHTCGTLAASSLKKFVQDPSAKAICNVGCCYHLLTEQFCRDHFPRTDTQDLTKEPDFPMSQFLTERKVRLGRTARLLAAQPIERLVSQCELPSLSLFYRALLQVIIRDKYGLDEVDQYIGRLFSQISDFPEYVTKGLEKLKLNPKEISRGEILEYLNDYSGWKRKLEGFFQYRVCLAAAVEALLLLDRVCFLLEKENVAKVDLVQLFDPRISPRCYAIIAEKQSLHESR